MKAFTIRIIRKKSDKEWINEIEIKAKQHVNKEERKNILKEKGFSILDSTKLLEKIYLR